MCAPPAPLHTIISVGPFAKWGIDFIRCNPHSAEGHAYIILAVDYFTKWAEAMPTFEANGKTAAIFIFNHIIARFGVTQANITDHGHHFRNVMMTELTVKTSTGFTPFQLVNGLEVVLPIECEISSLQMAIELLPANSEEERCLLYLAQLDENRRDATLAIESHEKCIKAQYDRNVTPRNFSEGDLILLYDQANDKLGTGKFMPMWHASYVVKRNLAKGAYELVDFNEVSLGKPRNGLYLKRYYA
eukprot:PITA_03833